MRQPQSTCPAQSNTQIVMHHGQKWQHGSSFDGSTKVTSEVAGTDGRADLRAESALETESVGFPHDSKVGVGSDTSSMDPSWWSKRVPIKVKIGGSIEQIAATIGRANCSIESAALPSTRMLMSQTELQKAPVLSQTGFGAR